MNTWKSPRQTNPVSKWQSRSEILNDHVDCLSPLELLDQYPYYYALRFPGGSCGRKYDPNQPRDEIGRWTDAGGGSASASASRRDSVNVLRLSVIPKHTAGISCRSMDCDAVPKYLRQDARRVGGKQPSAMRIAWPEKCRRRLIFESDNHDRESNTRNCAERFESRGGNTHLCSGKGEGGLGLPFRNRLARSQT